VPAAWTALVIDASGNVGKASTANVAGQVIRLGLNAGTYAPGEKALRFNSHNTATEMQDAANGADNFINTISGATITEAQAGAAGTGVPARTTDRISLPAGLYRVTVRLAGYFSAADPGNGAYVKFVAGNSEYSLEYTLANGNTVSNGDEVSDYVNLTGPSSLDFTLNSFANTFNVDSRAAAGTGQSYRSLILIERLR
jgi:hypothetical protein